MISYSPDGSSIYTPKHSFQKIEGYYDIDTSGSKNTQLMWQPVMHLSKNPLSNQNECAMPSSLVYHVRDKYPSASSLPSHYSSGLPTSPLFQFAKTTSTFVASEPLRNQLGYAKFKPGNSSPFTFSSRLMCGSIPPGSSTNGYLYLQPTGYSGNSSVLINNSGSAMNAGYTEEVNPSIYNQIIGITDIIRNYDKIKKTLVYAGSQYLGIWYHVAVNFLISVYSYNYKFYLANMLKFGVVVPFYCYYDIRNPVPETPPGITWIGLYQDTVNENISYWTHVANPDVWRLQLLNSNLNYARAYYSGMGGSTVSQGMYYQSAYRHDNYEEVWISGRVNFEVQMASSATCPAGYYGIVIGSPIIACKQSSDYLIDSSNEEASLIISCAENVEIWS